MSPRILAFLAFCFALLGFGAITASAEEPSVRPVVLTDNDRDGVPDEYEVLPRVGTNPNDRASVPVIGTLRLAILPLGIERLALLLMARNEAGFADSELPELTGDFYVERTVVDGDTVVRRKRAFRNSVAFPGFGEVAPRLISSDGKIVTFAAEIVLPSVPSLPDFLSRGGKYFPATRRSIIQRIHFGFAASLAVEGQTRNSFILGIGGGGLFYEAVVSGWDLSADEKRQVYEDSSGEVRALVDALGGYEITTGCLASYELVVIPSGLSFSTSTSVPDKIYQERIYEYPNGRYVVIGVDCVSCIARCPTFVNTTGATGRKRRGPMW